jgi:hypothetical protein
MFKKILVLLMFGTLPMFACGPNMGTMVVLVSLYAIPIGVIVWALSQLSKSSKKNNDKKSSND